MSLYISFLSKHKQIKRTGHMKSQNQLVLQPIFKNMLHFSSRYKTANFSRCVGQRVKEMHYTLLLAVHAYVILYILCCIQPILPACHRIVNSSTESTEQTRTKRALVSYPNPTGGIMMDCTNKTMHCSTVTKKAGSQTQVVHRESNYI